MRRQVAVHVDREPPGPRGAAPNNTIVGLGSGSVCVFSLAEADVLIDLVGVFGATGLTYVPTEPGRLLDTRDFGESLPAGTEVEYLVDGPLSATAAAASVNVTAVGHTSDGFTSTYACDSVPDTSTLNQFVGQIAANGAIIPLTPLATSCRVDPQRRPPPGRSQRLVDLTAARRAVTNTGARSGTDRR